MDVAASPGIQSALRERSIHARRTRGNRYRRCAACGGAVHCRAPAREALRGTQTCKAHAFS